MNTTRLPLLPAVVRERAQSTPDAPAVVAGANELSYADLHALVAALDGRLRHHGVRTGDRVAILGLNSIEWVVAFLACLDAGAVAAPLSYRLSPYELEQQIALLQPRLVLADEEFLEPVTAGARSAGATLLPLTGLDSGRESVWAGRSAGAVTAGGHAREPRADQLHLGQHRRAEGRRDHARGPRVGGRRLRRGDGDERGRSHPRAGPALPQHGLLRPARAHAAGRRNGRSAARVRRHGGARGPAAAALDVPHRRARHPAPARDERGRRGDLRGLPDRLLRRLAHARGVDRRTSPRAGRTFGSTTPTGSRSSPPSATCSTPATCPSTPEPSAARFRARSRGSSATTARSCRPARSGACCSQGRAG